MLMIDDREYIRNLMVSALREDLLDKLDQQASEVLAKLYQQMPADRETTERVMDLENILLSVRLERQRRAKNS